MFNKVIALFQKQQSTPDIISQPQNMQTVLTEVSANLGVSIAPYCISKLYTNGCRFIPLTGESINIPLEIQFSKGNTNRAVHEFVSFTLENKPLIETLAAISKKE